MLRIVAMAWVFILAGFSADAAELRFREEISVAGGMVRLADVAEFAGSDPAAAAAIEGVLLFPAPSPGKERTVRRSEIVELLRLAEIDCQQLALTGAEQVIIRRQAGGGIASPRSARGTRIGAASVEQSVQHALVSYLESHQPGDVAWSVAPAIPSRYVAPLKAAEEITVAGGSAPFTGRQSFELVARVAGHERRIPIEAEVAALPRAVVVVKGVAKGEVIRSDSVQVQPLSVDVAASERLLSREEVIGREATQSLLPGQPVTASQVQLPRIVRRGDKLTVRSSAAGVVITTSGKALQDGAVGDSISVELEEPKRQILAQVTGPQRVEIGTSATSRGPAVSPEADSSNSGTKGTP